LITEQPNHAITSHSRTAIPSRTRHNPAGHTSSHRVAPAMLQARHNPNAQPHSPPQLAYAEVVT